MLSGRIAPFRYHLYFEAGTPSLSLHRNSTTVPLRAEIGTSQTGADGGTRKLCHISKTNTHISKSEYFFTSYSNKSLNGMFGCLYI